MRTLIGLVLLLAHSLTFAATDNRDIRGVNDRATIVILGASYAKDWPVTQLAGSSVRNHGVGGDETSAMLARFEQDVVAHKPTAVIIWGFINDIFRSNADTLPDKIATTKNNLTQIIDRARRNGIKPIVATEVTIRPAKSLTNEVIGWISRLRGKRSYADYVNEHVLSVNDWLRTYARTNEIALLDLQPVLADADGLRKRVYATDDGSHLTPAAYEALTRFAESPLSQYLAHGAP